MWNEITPYSERKTKRPHRVLLCSLTPNISFKIHNHVHYGDKWLLVSDFVGVSMYDLDTIDMEEAKQKGMEVMLQLLKKKREEVDSAIGLLSAGCSK